MKIYISHSTNFDFKKELYEPLKNSGLQHEWIFPHNTTTEQYNSKELFANNDCDLVIAEVSHSSIGLGIELGWANIAQIRIVCVYKTNSKYSSSLKSVSNEFLGYTDSVDLVEKIKQII